MVNSTIIVTACKETKREELERVITNIKNVGGKISGIILNKITISSKKYDYQYYYYSSVIKKEYNNTKRLNIANDLKKEVINLQYKESKKAKEAKEENKEVRNTSEILKQINDYLQKQKNS